MENRERKPLESAWKVKFKQEKAIQFKIDGLSDSVKSYFAIGEVLRNTTLQAEEVMSLKKQRLDLLNGFKDHEEDEMVEHIEFMKEVNQHDRRTKKIS